MKKLQIQDAPENYEKHEVPIKPNYQLAQVNQYYEVPINYSSLEEGLWGFYKPSTRSVTLSTKLSADQNIFTKAHELAHAYGITDEDKADSYAAAQTGKGQYHRQFGFRPLPLRA